jgi:RNA polymerase sigma-70 factor (ECF subfamily)
MGGIPMIFMIYASIDDPSDRDFMLWLYCEFERLMFSVAKKYVSTPEDREDIVQDALIRLMKKIPELRAMERCVLASYIVSVIRNASINFLKREDLKESRCVPLTEEAVQDVYTEDDLYLLVYQKDLLSAIWDRLPEADRHLLEGRYVLGFSDEELAHQFRCKPGSIRMKVTRARRRVFALLTQNGEDE